MKWLTPAKQAIQEIKAEVMNPLQLLLEVTYCNLHHTLLFTRTNHDSLWQKTS